MSRRWLIIVSVGIHIGIAVGLFVSGIWRLDRLEPGKAALALGMMMPAGDPGGGGAEAMPAAKPVPKKKDAPKRLVKDPVQPVKLEKDPPAPELPATTGDTGDGDGTGDGTGTGKGDGPPGDGSGGGGGSGAPCLPGDPCSAPPVVTPPKVVAPQLVAPNVMSGLRIAGETQIMPPDLTKTAMLRDGKNRTVGSFKVCMDAGGRISSVAIAGSTKYAEYDAAIVGAIRNWRYQPYRVDGAPVPACSIVTFVYSMK